MNNQNITAPAHLIVGPAATTLAHTHEFIKATMCSEGGCLRCATCQQIEQHQHVATMWLEPENNYTLETIEPIFSTIAFALEPEHHYFFILRKADLLTAACANSLLKIVEEPPAGYHFVFLTERSQQILPTIRSRCVITNLYAPSEQNRSSDLVEVFKGKVTCHPSVFLSLLAQENPSEAQTIDFLDELLTHWSSERKKASETRDPFQENYMLELITEGLRLPPMPGSSKLFWKNFYLLAKSTPAQ